MPPVLPTQAALTFSYCRLPAVQCRAVLLTSFQLTCRTGTRQCHRLATAPAASATTATTAATVTTTAAATAATAATSATAPLGPRIAQQPHVSLWEVYCGNGGGEGQKSLWSCPCAVSELFLLSSRLRVRALDNDVDRMELTLISLLPLCHVPCLPLLPTPHSHCLFLPFVW